jgi:hypothetical protein
MSQNTLLTTAPSFGAIRISIGWDNPTQEAFCNAVSMEVDEDKEHDDKPSLVCLQRIRYQGIDDVLNTLKADGIVLPEAMIAAFKHDVEVGARNVIRVFNLDGSIQEAYGD